MRPAGGTKVAKSTANAGYSAQPRLHVLAGPNGSGKSTIQKELKPQWIGVFINADEIEHSLKYSQGELNLAKLGITAKPATVLRRLEKHIRNSAFAKKLGLHNLLGRMAINHQLILKVPAPYNSYLASVLADAIRRELLEEGHTFTFETVMSSRDKVEFMKEAKAKGYRVYLYFVATDDPEINIDRVRRRVMQGGHTVPAHKIRKRYRESIDLMTQACNVANRAYVFDNSGSHHKLLAKIEEQENEVAVTLHASRLNPWFTNTEFWRSLS